jgi:hypothetical protein
MTVARNQRHQEIHLRELRLSEEEKRRLEAAALHEDDALRALTKGVEAMVVSHEEAPVLLSVEEALLDPIKAAGQELKVEASYWASEENPIIEAVLSISQKVIYN